MFVICFVVVCGCVFGVCFSLCVCVCCKLYFVLSKHTSVGKEKF